MSDEKRGKTGPGSEQENTVQILLTSAMLDLPRNSTVRPVGGKDETQGWKWGETSGWSCQAKEPFLLLVL